MVVCQFVCVFLFHSVCNATNSLKSSPRFYFYSVLLFLDSFSVGSFLLLFASSSSRLKQTSSETATQLSMSSGSCSTSFTLSKTLRSFHLTKCVPFECLLLPVEKKGFQVNGKWLGFDKERF